MRGDLADSPARPLPKFKEKIVHCSEGMFPRRPIPTPDTTLSALPQHTPAHVDAGAKAIIRAAFVRFINPPSDMVTLAINLTRPIMNLAFPKLGQNVA
jgi:hypothetical protein